VTDERPLADLAVSIGAVAAFGVAAGMVGLRGVLRPEVTAVALAGVVAITARAGGRPAGAVAALMSGLSFDFFHTEPYLSLKISDPSDLLVAALLLVLGLQVEGQATSRQR
jgi:two-component system sensor histidine kinase KdpD